MRRVIFACIHNAGRSQMAAAFFNALADNTKASAVSAGTKPAERVHDAVVQVMREVGIELRDARPQLLTTQLAEGAALLITMGYGKECPYVPGLRTEDWPIPDPKGMPPERVREIRDEVRKRVAALVASEGYRNVSITPEEEGAAS